MTMFAVFKPLKNLNLGVFMLIIHSFLLVMSLNYSAEEFPLGEVIQWYVLFYAFIFAIPRLRSTLFQKMTLPGLMSMLSFGIGTYALLSVLTVLDAGQNFVSLFGVLKDNFFAVFFTGFLLAVVEEQFRWAIEILLGGSRYAFLYSSFVFAGMHYFAYSQNVISMILIFFISIGWTMLRKNYGIMSAVGSHWGYNVFLMLGGRF